MHLTDGRAFSGTHFLTPVPALPSLVLPRQALVSRVLSTPAGGTCAVYAAPGYGRTTVLAQAVHGTDERVVWTSVGAWSDDPREYLAHVRSLLDLPSTAQASAAALVAALTTDPTNSVLVVDDLDDTQQPELAATIAAIADQLPPHWRLFVGLRRQVSSAIARLRTSGRLVTIDQSDLALSPTESMELVRLLDPTIETAAAEHLVSLADGWPVALVEALRSWRSADPGDPSGWLLAVGIDRLFEPVLDEMEPADLNFLIDCSVLDVLDADACAAISGDANAHVRLKNLAAGGWYLTRDPQSNTCRLHPLLTEYLRRCLAARGSRAVADVRRQAAAVAVSSGDLDAAIRHFMEADDYVSALDLIETSLEKVMDHGGFDTVRDWYDLVPAEVHRRHIHLLGEAWAALLGGELTKVDAPLAELDRAVAEEQRSVGEFAAGSGGAYGLPGWLAAQVNVLHAYRASWLGMLVRTHREAVAAQRLFGDSWGAMAPRVAQLLLIRECLWLGDATSARPLLAELIGRPGVQEMHRQITIPSEQALLAAIEGRPRRATYMADQALSRLDAAGEAPPITPLEARLARAIAMADLGEPAQSLQDADFVATWGDNSAHVPYAVLGRVARGRALSALGRTEEAFDALSEAATKLRAAAPGSALLAEVLAAEASLRLDRGDTIGAERLVSRLPRQNRYALLQVRLMQIRRPGSGVPNLASMQPQTSRERAQRAVLLASAALANGRIAEADRYVTTVGDIADETGFLVSLVGAPDDLVDFADRIAARTGNAGLAAAVDVGRQWRADSVTISSDRPVSAGELELLAMLEDRPGNEELALRLGVSVNTVKTRLQRLYRKLGVTSRAEALQRARELQLVKSGARSVTRSG